MKKIIVLCAAISVTAGCSSDSTSNGGTANGGAVTHALLNGTWGSSCISFSGISFNNTVTYNNGFGIVTFRDYSDTGCTIISMIDNDTFTYTLGNNVFVDGSVSGIMIATEINTTYPNTFAPMDFDIIAIAANKIYLGEFSFSNDGSSPTKRPTQLDATSGTRQ